ncbi:MAG: replication restart helicase PriA [Polaribacter sp.]
MVFFVDVILPVPIKKMFTYRITESEFNFVKKGTRLAVPFGKNKIYTGLVFSTHLDPPTAYEAKDIYQILDKNPIVTEKQLQHWEWLGNYYMCSLGEVFRAAIPSALLLESETNIYLNKNFHKDLPLSDDEFLILEALEHHTQLSVHQISDILDKKGVMPVINGLLEKSVIYVKEEIYKQYKPKLVKYVRLTNTYADEDELKSLLELLHRAPKQKDAVLGYFQLSASQNLITPKLLESEIQISQAVINSLEKKGVFEFFYHQKDRISFTDPVHPLKSLSQNQTKAYLSIKEKFTRQNINLLHGVTSSGKTEIYVKLIEDILPTNKQVLFLLPEIALTTQIIGRLQNYFGDKISVFHSKYSMNERVEVWNNVLNNKSKAQIIIGARSALFLPFSNLGFIVVDEEHETSYKQFDPAPRYNARDAAIVLGTIHNSKVLLGSATPSIESYHNCQIGKFGLIELHKRFGDVQMPKIELVNIREKTRKKRMTGWFSDRLIEGINNALNQKEQVILFQNRRGFSPIVECKTCGTAPQCPNCDVSLTYHKYRNELRCHYCSYVRAMPNACDACGNSTLDAKGFGTEQIELELQELFPNHKTGRMDLDTTRGKFGYQKIINAFEAREIDILVGTQMLSKGLDFDNVSLVGILNADNLLNFPDFRAYEKAFQLMVQVSGRAGRFKKQGNVLIQTYNPEHQTLQQVIDSNYLEMFNTQLKERRDFHYPPFYRLIKITLKHKDFQKVNTGVQWLGKALQNSFGTNVLGPSTPAISRIRNQYIKNIVIKIPPEQSLDKTKSQILKVRSTFEAVKEFRSIRMIIDVDPY